MKDFIVLIPFSGMYEPEKFVRKYSIERYTVMFLPNRGKNNPEKFILIIEDYDIKKISELPFTFETNYDNFFCKDKTELALTIQAINSSYNKKYKYFLPYVKWKLTNYGYIYFSANITKPIIIFK